MPGKDIDNDKEIAFGRFTVRPVRENDLPAMLARRNEDAIRRIMFTEHVITWEEHKAWFDRIAKLAPKLHFIVEREGLAIGYFGYVKVNFADGVCYSSLYSLPGGREIPLSGLYFTEISLEYAFSVLKIRKVCGEVLAKVNAGRIFSSKLLLPLPLRYIIFQHPYQFRMHSKNSIYTIRAPDFSTGWHLQTLTLMVQIISYRHTILLSNF